MTNEYEVKIPDLGNVSDVDVIEVMVAPGDTLHKEDSMITVESDKASMEIPAPRDGVVKEVKLAVGDKVSAGDVILIISDTASIKEAEEAKSTTATQKRLETILVPDLGGTDDVDVIEIMASAGDTVNKEDSLITLESDKASMEIPSPYSGKVREVKVKLGSKVSHGDPILTMDVDTADIIQLETGTKHVTEKIAPPAVPVAEPAKEEAPAPTTIPSTAHIYAGPAVRRIAYEFGIDLNKVKGTGRKGRIVKEDIQNYVKQRLQAQDGGVSIPAVPAVDFSKFGEVETQPLNKIKRITASHTHRSWLSVPHVTQFDEADITELEAFRQSENKSAKECGYKLSPLPFIMVAVANALQEFPQFNASLDPSGEKLIIKKYCHIGIAVDTVNGLVVPVVRNVNQKSIMELAQELVVISQKARDKKLMPDDMQGGCFTISSLGGIGGIAFTPIVNMPEVAILGVSRSKLQPVYQKDHFEPRLILPLSLSYDHRVIDGAEAARFTRYLAECLVDLKRLLL